MPNPTFPSGPSAVVDRLIAATNDHDLDAIVACFSPDYVNETPVHPARGFTGREQVRQNWTMILGAVPDVRVEILRRAVDGDVVWTEQEHRGTRPDGSAHVMRGVLIFTVAGDLITHLRFYLEPVDPGEESVDELLSRQLGGGKPA